ncbi:Protein RALF-like 19 [Hibiscus syriacus]|uniref:Protein RALF-like 19 n=1 Tax=Hibiscus syriacus TaxID=106335 RepID=A0A6A3A0C7_HIBSY|nr:rapid alkalinization factor-like [Hibiscus syriacus]KAE8696625.1 Protein RALF-like 19 [Hibiscus syriacus]
MSNHLSCALLIFFLALSAASSSSHAAINWGGAMFPSMVRYRSLGATQTCDGVSGECKEYVDESLSAETARSLAGKRYISYSALRQNAVPCNQRGQSYYNCGAAGGVNPYTRGCSVITLCARVTD